MRRLVVGRGTTVRLCVLVVAGLALCVGVVGLGAGSGSQADDVNVTVYDATGIDADSADAIRAAVDNGSVRTPEELVAGDTLLIAIDSERLATDVAERNGSTTERFFDVLDGEADLRILQTNFPPDRPIKAIRLGPENATAYRTDRGAYLVVDTGELDVEFPEYGEDEAQLRDGDRFAVTFGYGLDDVVDRGFSAGRSDFEFGLYTAASDLRSTQPVIEKAPPAVVNHTVAVNAGMPEDHRVRISLEDGSTVNRTVGTVPWARTSGASLDLRGVEPGTAYTLELRYEDELVERYNGTVTPPEATITDPAVVRTGGQTRLNATVTLSHGGEVGLFNGTGMELTTARFDAADEPIEPGVETTVSFLLATDAGYGPASEVDGTLTEEVTVRALAGTPGGWSYDGRNASATASVSELAEALAEQEAGTTPTPTERGGATPTAADGSGGDATVTATDTGRTPAEFDNGTTPTEADDNGAGFGLVAALVALGVVGAVLLVRRSIAE